MSKVIDLEAIRQKKEDKIALERVEAIALARAGIVAMLEHLDIEVLDAAVSMQIVVNKIIEHEEWDTDEFKAMVSRYMVIDKGIH